MIVLALASSDAAVGWAAAASAPGWLAMAFDAASHFASAAAVLVLLVLAAGLRLARPSRGAAVSSEDLRP